jgi:transposase
MDAVVERCAGLDVHRDNVVATVRFPSEDHRRWKRETHTFKSTLGGLLQLGEWLAGFGVTLVGMEATACTGSPSFRCWRSASSAGS